MKKVKTLIIAIAAFILLMPISNSYADYTYIKPNVILLDKNKSPISNVTKSTDYARCLQKANSQGVGVYYCKQPDIKVIVTGEIVEDNTVTVSWTTPTQNTDNSELTDLAGFKVYYGESENDLSTVVSIDNASTKSVEISDLTPSNYYFAVTAVNSIGVESSLSNIVSKKKII